MTGSDSKSLDEAPTIVATGADAESLRSFAPNPEPMEQALTVLSERYELLALVGAGAMGSVYRARDRELDEIVALKMLRAEFTDSAYILERFKREVKLARRISHASVARVFDIGEHEGRRFLTMEFIAGESLAALLTGRPPLSVARGLAIAQGICAGLAAAHEAGVVHRDLKPDNVMMTPAGKPVITDFGIARTLEADDAKRTAHGAVVGTPAYMAPEQVEGKRVDERTDVYALGVLLYELLTGELPFNGDSPYMVAAKRLTEAPPDPRSVREDLPETVARVILKCLARRPEDRYPSAGALAQALASGAPTHVPGSPASTSHGAATSTVTSLTDASVPRTERTVAVLPFANSGTDEDAFVAEGLSEDLIDTLSMTRGLRVKPHSALADVNAADPQAWGRELGVEVVVTGSVRRRGDALRVSARVITVSDGFQLWAERFDRPASSALVISDEVAQAIARALTVEAEASQRSAPTDPMAIELYLRGRAELRKLGQEPFARAVKWFAEAHQRAPEDATILAAYARACARAWFFGSIHDDLGARARSLAALAFERAPSSADSLLVKATVAFADGQVSEAVVPLLLTLRLAPALAEAHELLGRIRVEVGPVEEGLRILDRTHELDPALDGATLERARTLALMDRWEEAEAAMAQVMDNRAAVITPMHARFALWGRDPAPFLTALNQLPEEVLPGPATFARAVAQTLSLRTVDPTLINGIVDASRDDSRPPRFRTFLFQILAELHGYVGEIDGVVSALERCVDAGLIDLVWLDRAPPLRAASSHPRFIALREQVAQRAERIRLLLDA
ncbi:MAG: protein kinase [Polyangiaceae bacterium]